MVFQFSGLFGNRINGNDTGPHRPLINQFPVNSISHPSRLGTAQFDLKKFWHYFRKNPELMSPIWLKINDIAGDRPHWVSNDGLEQPLGRNTEKKAKKFWVENRGKETIKAFLFDRYVTGNGYIWVGKPTLEERMNAVKEIMAAFKSRLSIKEYNKALLLKSQDEDLKLPKKFDYVASSSVQIEFDNYEILQYVQQVSGIRKNFTPKEIIHSRLMTIDGQVVGFTPIESLWAEISLLWLVKGNMIAVMENGGSPDTAVVMENEIAGGPNHKYLVDVLTKYKSVSQRHGMLVLTGKANFEKIGSEVSDLQYKELALYITSQIAYALHMPVTRIPYLIGSSATNGDSGGLSESGYWKSCSEEQDEIEDLLNTQLFGPLGWWIRFPRGYKQDEVRESQTNSMNADTITKYQSIGREYKKKPTLTKVNQLINFKDDDWEDIPEDELLDPLEKTGLMNQNMLSTLNTEKEPDNRKRADTKKNVANQKGAEEAGV